MIIKLNPRLIKQLFLFKLTLNMFQKLFRSEMTIIPSSFLLGRMALVCFLHFPFLLCLTPQVGEKPSQEQPSIHLSRATKHENGGRIRNQDEPKPKVHQVLSSVSFVSSSRFACPEKHVKLTCSILFTALNNTCFVLVPLGVEVI